MRAYWQIPESVQKNVPGLLIFHKLSKRAALFKFVCLSLTVDCEHDFPPSDHFAERDCNA